MGDKYGYRPIPSSMTEDVFRALASQSGHVTTPDDAAWTLVEDWYRKDENAMPAVYVLQPISSKIPDIAAVSVESISFSVRGVGKDSLVEVVLHTWT